MNRAVSKDAFHRTGVINQEGDLLLMQKVAANQWKTPGIKCLFTLLMRCNLSIMGSRSEALFMVSR